MIMKILMAARPAYTQSGHLSLNDDSFFFLMFSNIFIASEQETDKFSFHPSSPLLLFPLPFSLRQAARFKLNFTLCPLTLGFTHSPLCSSTHTCAHPPVPELTCPHLDSPTHSWAHTQAHPLTPRLIHSHPCSPIHTHAHPLTPVLTHSHQGSSAHTWAHFSSKVIGQRIKHEMQARVLLCTMPGPPITANPASGVCNPIVFFPRLSQVASRWGAGGCSTSRAEHAHHVLSDKQP